ncbi:hypothetical protein C8A01DRAFT_35955 [Parachaetomium inaequale]|uniref:DUF3752 domain-containing protein n=1 Tax=Parachaetomium inaequale TaxID=2588326 RepID=A0AAN6PJ41_9PEZI|nr:hypothetical protein C8A01DRAFT_35955 [Parachaetomium inaequale]
MSSIGPQLPPHLQKRKRTPEDETELGSPPPKTSRRDNDNEIPLDDDSDDGYGPSASAPSSKNNAKMGPSRPATAIGPSLPPTVANSSARAPADKTALDTDSDDDVTGPAPPRKAGPAPPPKRVLGPAPPPAPLSERPLTNPDPDSSEDDDDSWGPALPGASSAISKNPSSTTPNGPTHPSLSHIPEPAAPKRDDWMLAPPTSSGPRAPDPTKLKARKFASGPRAATSADGKPSGISSIWTETPEEKIRRLANAVLGREDPNNAHIQSSTGPRRPDVSSSSGSVNNSGNADSARIKSYTEQTRGKSLVAEHQAARAAGKASSAAKLVKAGDSARWGAKASSREGEDGGGVEEDDDPSKRAFDWEKDMKVGGQISGSQRRELLNKAANFGGRFQSGKYL